MSISTLFKPKPDTESQGVAAEALAALKSKIAALADEDAQWVTKETTASRELRRHDDAQQLLRELEERRLNAAADIEVRGSSTEDITVLDQQLREQRDFVSRLAERRRLAEKVLERIRAERTRIREQNIAASRSLPAALHATVLERLHDLAPRFLEAEKTYLALLSEVFGAARLADKIARRNLEAGGVHLGWTGGDLNVAQVFTPRPSGESFYPVPQRPDIAKAIQDAADDLERAL
jgi:chromosome segregation ATPase